jgi:hypothetical protein
LKKKVASYCLTGEAAMAKKPKHDPKREEHINMEIVVDCYDNDERAMGWYCHLQGQLRFPFTAICINQRPISPLRVKDEVEVIGVPPEEECHSEMFVTNQWDRPEGLAVPLAQLKPIANTDERTKEAVADWHCWCNMGYEY